MADNGEPEPGGDDALLLALATGSTINEAADRAGATPPPSGPRTPSNPC